MTFYHAPMQMTKRRWFRWPKGWRKTQPHIKLSFTLQVFFLNAADTGDFVPRVHHVACGPHLISSPQCAYLDD